MAAEWRPSRGRVAVKYRPGVGRHACRFMSTDTRPTLGRHIGRVSVDISAECRSPYRPRVSTDTRPTDALSTHDPNYQLENEVSWANFYTFKKCFNWHPFMNRVYIIR